MASIPSIPDDLIRDILLRLPAAAVLRSRAVCKGWRALVDDPRFPGDHHRRRSPAPLLRFRRDDPADPLNGPRHFRVRLEALDLRARATQPLFRFTAPARRYRRTRVPRRDGRPGSEPGPLITDEGDLRVHGSCDGVLLVSYKSGAYLCNPSRRRWSWVDAPSFDGIVGFYAHPPSAEFRLLHRGRRDTGSVDHDYRVLTLSPRPAISRSRRIAGGPHSDESLAAIRLRPASESPPAIVAGNLHWLPQPEPGNSSDLLAFDTVSETFRRMRPPQPPPDAVDDAAGYGRAQMLLELDGKLAMTVTRGGLAAAELWVLQSYEREDSWVRRLRVPLPAADIARLGGGAVAIVSPQGDVVVRCAGCVLQCDATGRVRAQHRLEHHRLVAVPHMFRESLVPHRSVDGREVRIGWEGIPFPPFFIDCNCPVHSSANNTEIGGG